MKIPDQNYYSFTAIFNSCGQSDQLVVHLDLS